MEQFNHLKDSDWRGNVSKTWQKLEEIEGKGAYSCLVEVSVEKRWTGALWVWSQLHIA